MLVRNIITLITLNGLALARKQKSEYLPASAIAKVSTVQGYPHVSVTRTHLVSMIARSFSEHDPSHFSHGPIPTDFFASKGSARGPENGDPHHTFNTAGADTGHPDFFADHHKSARVVETNAPEVTVLARNPAPEPMTTVNLQSIDHFTSKGTTYPHVRISGKTSVWTVHPTHTSSQTHSKRAEETATLEANLIARAPTPTSNAAHSTNTPQRFSHFTSEGTAYVEYNIYGTTVVMPMATQPLPKISKRAEETGSPELGWKYSRCK